MEKLHSEAECPPVSCTEVLYGQVRSQMVNQGSESLHVLGGGRNERGEEAESLDFSLPV